MSPKHASILVVSALPFLTLGGLRAADAADSGEARLRETLRSTMLQLRDAQTDLANLQAKQAADAADTKAVNDRLEALKKQSEAYRIAAEKSVEAVTAKLSAETAENARLTATLAQWKAAAEQASAAGQAAEAQRAKLASAYAALERRAEDLQGKNGELFRLGNEILTRYQKFSLGEQFLAREPFIGRARVELENLIQEYDDKLLAQQAPP